MTQSRVLVVEDNAITRKMVRVTLEGAGYAVLEAADGKAALDHAGKRAPDLIIQDLVLPDMDGIELVSRLRALPDVAGVSIVAFSGFLSKMEEARASQSGFTDYLFKPVEPSRLLQAVEAYLAEPARRMTLGGGARVVVADHDQTMRRLMTVTLEREGFNVVTALDGAEALALARETPPDAVVAAVLMPRLDGFRLCLAVRQDPRLARTRVVLVTSAFIEEEDRRLARRVGASAFIVRTPDFADAMRALVESLAQELPPFEVSPVDVVAEEYAHRMVRQLEHQATLNMRLTRRLALREAELAILGSFASSLGSDSATVVVEEMFLCALDAAGVSRGSLYLLEPDGRLTLSAGIGYAASDPGPRSCFGHEHLVREIISTGEPIEAPSARVAGAEADDLLARAGARSLLIAAVQAGGERLGALMLASEYCDLRDDWMGFTKAAGSQIGQAVALLRAFSRTAAAEARFRKIFENAVVGIYQATPDGRLIRANSRMARIFGYDSTERMMEAVTGIDRLYSDPARRAELLRAVDAGEVVTGSEQSARRADGTPIVVSVNATAVRDEGGRTVLHEGIVEDITARKQAETALIDSERRYRVLAENVTDVIVVLDMNLRPTYVSPSVTQLLGFTAVEALGKRPDDIVTPGSLRFVMDTLAQEREAEDAGRGSPSRTLELELRRKDGTTVWAEARISFLRGDDGRPAGILTVTRDISERRRTEETTTALAEVGGILSRSLDPDVVAKLATESVCKLLGASAAALYRVVAGSLDLALQSVSSWPLGESDWLASLPLDGSLSGIALSEGRLQAVPDVLRDGRLHYTAEVRAWVERSGQASRLAVPLQIEDRIFGLLMVRDRTGREYQASEIGVARAFADHVALAIDKAELYEEMRRGKEQYRLLFDENPHPMWVHDRETLRFLAVNEAAIRRYGYPRDEFLGMTSWDIHPAADVDACMHDLCEHRNGTHSARSSRLRLKDGTLVDVEITYCPILFRGEPAMLVLAVDVTARVKAERELEQQQQLLYQSEKLAAMGQLLAGVAHELNNPLSIVLGHAALLSGSDVDEAIRARAAKIRDSAERCSRIVKNFVTLARQRPPERQKVSLEQIVREALELVAYPLRADGVEVQLGLADQLPALWADPTQLSQVLINLFTNAHHALRASARERRITVVTRHDRARGVVTCSVADTGIGIAPDTASRIFEPFFTTKPVGQGTGLGLSLCRSIAESHGGSIRLEETPGGGATFIVELPVQEAPALQARATAPSVVASARILVVDDEREVGELLIEFLGLEGHRAELASNGVRALEKVEAGAWDAIISDVRMPGLDGPGLYRKLEALRHPLVQRFVFLTGDDLTPETAQFLEQVVAPTLGKPFRREEIQAVLGRVLPAGRGDAPRSPGVAGGPSIDRAGVTAAAGQSEREQVQF